MVGECVGHALLPCKRWKKRSIKAVEGSLLVVLKVEWGSTRHMGGSSVNETQLVLHASRPAQSAQAASRMHAVG
jgi:hypothetical protein